MRQGMVQRRIFSATTLCCTEMKSLTNLARGAIDVVNVHRSSVKHMSMACSSFTFQKRWESSELLKEKNHKCHICDKQFLGKLALENHLATRHYQRSAGQSSIGHGSSVPQSFQSLIDGYDARRIERIDRKKYSKEPLIINGKPETEEERKSRLKKVIEEREQLRHKSVSVTDIPIVLSLVEMWDQFALALEQLRKEDYEEGEILPPPHTQYTPVTLEQIKEYIEDRKKELGYDEDAHSWMSDGIPLSVFKAAGEKKREKQSEELQKVHFGNRQLNSMTEPNPYQMKELSDISDLPFSCSKCGKRYRSKMSMEFHYNTTCNGDNNISSQKENQISSTEVEESNVNLKETYFEGVPPRPQEPTSEERSIAKHVERKSPPNNPFEKEAVHVNIYSSLKKEQINIGEKSNIFQEQQKSCNPGFRLPFELESNDTQKSAPAPRQVPDLQISCSQEQNMNGLLQTTSNVMNPFQKLSTTISRNSTEITENLNQTVVERNESSRMSSHIIISPFKLASIKEKDLRTDGIEDSKGLSDEREYNKIIEKITLNSKNGQSTIDTAETALDSTVDSQHRMLKSFTKDKVDRENPFQTFSSGVRSSTSSLNTKSKNPFSPFSVKPACTLSNDKLPSSCSNTGDNKPQPPAYLKNISDRSTSDYVCMKQNESSMWLSQPPNPFLKCVSFVRKDTLSNKTEDDIDKKMHTNALKTSKSTCPQCGMTFRLQAALDAHISTSHTVASSLYTSSSLTESSEVNPFQPKGAVPTIPVDPFTH